MAESEGKNRVEQERGRKERRVEQETAEREESGGGEENGEKKQR